MRLWVFSLLLLVWSCALGQVTEKSCDASQGTVDIRTTGANAVIGGLFDIHQSGAPSAGCGPINLEMVQVFEAAKWAINQVNLARPVNRRIGLKAYDTCSSADIAVNRFLDFYPEYQSMNYNCSQSTTTVNLGILGPYDSASAIAVSKLANTDIPAPILSPGASTPELDDNKEAPFFIRTIQSDSSKVKAIIALLKHLVWNRIVVFYSDDLYGAGGYEKLVEVAYQEDICFVHGISISSNMDPFTIRDRYQLAVNSGVGGAVFFGTESIARLLMSAIFPTYPWIFSDLDISQPTKYGRNFINSFVVSSQSTVVRDFKNYWVKINPIVQVDNPWYTEWYTTTYNCDLTTCPVKSFTERENEYQQSPLVAATIAGIYAYVRAFTAIEALTFQNIQDMTPNQVYDYILDADFTIADIGQVAFDSNGNFRAGYIYDIFRYEATTSTSSFTVVGNYSSTTRSLLLDVSGIPVSDCAAAGCNDCILSQKMLDYTYIPGDILIGGAFISHATGSEPLTCGELDSFSLQHITATLYAMDRLKVAFPSILPGVNLGLIYFDYCTNDWLEKSFVSGLLSGRLRLKDDQNRRIESGEIKAFIETGPNPAFMAELLGSYHMPSINPWATNPVLSDTTLYPYFTRTVPDDTHQVIAMLKIMQKMGWSHAQVIYIPMTYGRGALEQIRRLGAQMSICVSASYEFGAQSSANDLVNNLRRHPTARAVIVFLPSSLVNAIFQEVKALNAEGEFVFIGSELWANDNGAVTGVEDVAYGSITLQLMGETSPGLDSFINTLSGFDEWYEQLHNCYRKTENQDKYSVPCGTNALTSSTLYQQFSYAPYTINAVYSLAHALDETLTQFCGSSYSGVCSAFRGSPAVTDVLLQKLREVSFTDAGTTFSMKDGQGVTGYKIFNYRPIGYINIGNYDISSKTLTFDPTNLAVNSQSAIPVMSNCITRCVQCDYVESYVPTFYMPGDIMIGGLIGLHQFIEGQAVCHTIDVMGLQYPMTVAFALDQINSGKGPVLLNDVSLGSVIIDHCGNPTKTKSALSAIYTGKSMLDVRSLRAWITDSTSAAIEINDLIKNQSIPIISPAATPTLLNNVEMFPTFFRTLPGDDKTARAIAKLLLNLNFGFVQLVSTNDEYGISGSAIFRSFALQEGICVIESYEVDAQDRAADIVTRLLEATTDVVVIYASPVFMANLVRAKTAAPNLIFITPYMVPEVSNGQFADGMLSLSLPSFNNDAFNQYLMNTQTTNPDLVMYYEQLFKCDLPGNSMFGVQCSGTMMDSMWMKYATPTINAIYAFSVALNRTLEVMCGIGYVGLCNNFLYSEDTNEILLGALDGAMFMDGEGSIFSFLDREGDITYNVYQWRETSSAYFQVASYKDATLTFTINDVAQYYPNVESTCFSPCIRCLSGLMNFTYIPGDILLGGLFDAHEKNINAFSCGSINTIKGFELLEAFNYALQSVNDRMFPDILNGVKLGGVGLDTCQSSIRTGYLVSNLHNGLMVLNRDGKDIDPKTIDTYIGSYSSDRSIHLARILRDLEIPQISYGSTSIALDDAFRYPYFLRTVPSDHKQAAAMAEFLDKQDLRYVQVVHSRDGSGISAKDAFSNLASSHQLCIAQMVTIPVNGTLTNEIFNDVVLSMLDKPAANTIILFAPSNYVNALLRAIGRNVEAQGKFHFLGSESWANSVDAIAGVTQWAVDSITLKPGGKRENTKFRDYLMTKLPGNYPENPWFSEYYEEIHNCYLSVPRAPYTRRCQTSTLPVTEAIGRYAQDPSVNDVVNAVYSAAIGIHNTLVHYCGANYKAVCEAYRSATLKRETILTKIKDVSFVDDVDNAFYFEESRNGNKGYFFQQIEIEGSYNDIGDYTSDGILNVKYTNRWDGSCDRTGACSECPSVRNRLARYSITYPPAPSANIATIAGIFHIHNAGNDFRCGALRSSDFEKSLAFFYGIQLANTVDPGSIRRNLPFQGIAIDACGSSLRVYQDVYNLISGNGLCNTDIDFNGKDFGDSLVGFLTIDTDGSMAASRVLSPLRVSQISPLSRSTVFSNFNEYPYFMRTVPPHQVAMSVVAQFLLENKWMHISTVFYDNLYGTSSNNDLKSETFKRRICVGLSIAAPATLTLVEAKAIVQQLEANKGATVVVLDVSPTVARIIIQAISELGLNDRFIIFGAIYQILDGNDNLVDGSLVVRLRSTQVPGFNQFVTGLTYTDHKDIAKDWFEEFYQNIHQCQLLDAKVQKSEFTKLCDKTEVITEDMFTHADSSLNTIYATYAMALGAKFFFDANCDGINQLSECLKTVDNARDKLFNAILAVQWPRGNPLINTPTTLEDSGFPFNFTEGRYWDIGYTIETYVKADNKFQPVARWWADSFPNGTHYMEGGQKPESVCPSGNCGCVFPDDLSANQNSQTSGDGKATLRNYLSYRDNGEPRYTWPIWAIVLSLLSCIGIIFTMIILIYLLIVYPVREGTTILGFMILIGILGIYAVNFAFFLPASIATCTGRRFGLGMVYAICMAAMLVKAIDNWRKKDAQYEKAKCYKGLTSSCGLLMATLGIILVQVIIPTIWLIMVPPTWTDKSNPLLQHDHKWCDPSDLVDDRVIYDIGLVLSMLFVIFLVLLTIIFAALGWDSESNSYESRWLLVGATCTAGCFLVWMIVSTSADPPFRDVAVAIGNFVNASALFICIPLRKMLMLISYMMESNREKKQNRVNENQYDDPATFHNDAFQTDLDFD